MRKGKCKDAKSTEDSEDGRTNEWEGHSQVRNDWALGDGARADCKPFLPSYSAAKQSESKSTTVSVTSPPQRQQRKASARSARSAQSTSSQPIPNNPSDATRPLPADSPTPDAPDSLAITVATAPTTPPVPRKKRVKLTIRSVFLPVPQPSLKPHTLTHACPNSPVASHPDAGTDLDVDLGEDARPDSSASSSSATASIGMTPPSPGSGSVIVIPRSTRSGRKKNREGDSTVKMMNVDAPTKSMSEAPAPAPAPALGNKTPGTKRIKLLVRRPDPQPSGSNPQEEVANAPASPTGLVRRASSGSGSESDGLVTPESAPHALPAVVSPSSSSGPSSALMSSAWGGKGKGKSVECYALAASPTPAPRKGKGKGKDAPWLTAEHALGEAGDAAKDRANGGAKVGADTESETESDVETESGERGRLCAMCAAWQKALRAGGGAACVGFAPPDPEACEMCRAGAGAGAGVEEGMAVDGPVEGKAEEDGVRAPDETAPLAEMAGRAVLDTDLNPSPAPAADADADIELELELDDDAEFLYPDWDPYTLPRDEQFARELLALLHGRPLPSSPFSGTPSSAFAGGASPATPEPAFLSSRPAHVSVV